MRDFALILIIFGSLPLIFLEPQVGILMWFWGSLTDRHRLTCRRADLGSPVRQRIPSVMPAIVSKPIFQTSERRSSFWDHSVMHRRVIYRVTVNIS